MVVPDTAVWPRRWPNTAIKVRTIRFCRTVDVSADSPTADLLPRSADGGRRQSRRLIAHPADGFAYLSILPNGELPRSAADFPSVCTGSAQFSHRNKLTLNSLAVSSSLASVYMCVSFRPQLAPASAGAFCYQRLRGAAAGSDGRRALFVLTEKGAADTHVDIEKLARECI